MERKEGLARGEMNIGGESGYRMIEGGEVN